VQNSTASTRICPAFLYCSMGYIIKNRFAESDHKFCISFTLYYLISLKHYRYPHNDQTFDRPALPVPRPGRDREARRDRVSDTGDCFLRELNNKHYIFNTRSGPGINMIYRILFLPCMPVPLKAGMKGKKVLSLFEGGKLRLRRYLVKGFWQLHVILTHKPDFPILLP
jgi:hypothetical protein